MIMPALHISFICSATSSFDQVHIKLEQPQVLSPDSHLTIDTIHQAQNAANVLLVWRHYSWHVASPAVMFIMLRFTIARCKTLVLPTRNVINE